MVFIFLDESGQFKKHETEKYFVIATFTVSDPRRTGKRFKSWLKNKFSKKMRNREIKFSNSGINKDLRIRTLQFIASLDVRIRYSFVRNENIPDIFKTKNRIESGLLYAHMVGETLEMYLPNTDLLFHVFCDNRDLQGLGKNVFVKNLTTRLLPNTSKGTNVKIQMVDSSNYVNIQIVDWIVGSIAWYLNQKPLGDKVYEILKNNIVGEGNEMFKDYWRNKFTK